MVYMLLYGEYVSVLFKNLNNMTPCTQIDATKQNLDYEMTFFRFTSNGEDPYPFSSTLQG